MANVIEETSTITAKGQTTIPKSVRRALGVDYGGKIAFRVENGRVTVRNPRPRAGQEHRDPALAAFLTFLDADIDRGNVRELPKSLVAAMQRAKKHARVNLDERLDGDVSL